MRQRVRPGWSRNLPKRFEPIPIRKAGDPGASPAFKKWQGEPHVRTAPAPVKPKKKGLRTTFSIRLPFVRTTANYNLYGLDREALDRMAPEDRPAVRDIYVSRYLQPDPSDAVTVTIEESD